jgi:3-phosphoshikimate 1-carboxyvinyltransferase
MQPITILPCQGIRGTVEMPGDKSISHRAAICAALAVGRTRIDNFLFSDDGRVTLDVLRKLGVVMDISQEKARVVVTSKGVFKKPAATLRMGESGTSARVLMGLLAALPFATTIDAAPSLRKRPMARVITPLRQMGARMAARKIGAGEFLPVHLEPAFLRGIHFRQDVASAQVKSAILLAGLFADGKTSVTEPLATRDHTERMLAYFGGRIRVQKNTVTVEKGLLKTPREAVVVPGDISSAAFFIVAALLTKKSKLLIQDVGINPTRMGLVRVLQRMGGRIHIKRTRRGFEPVADIEVLSSSLRAAVVEASEIPAMIDELPILMVAAALAKGKTVLKGVEELRVKETDRIRSMESNLLRCGVPVAVKATRESENLEITGVSALPGGVFCESFHDHRTAMSMVVAGLVSQRPIMLDDPLCMTKSFPGFMKTLNHLLVR